MIIVNTSHQNFDISVKIAEKNLQPIISLILRSILPTSSFTGITKIFKNVFKNIATS